MGFNQSPTRPQAEAITITVAQPEDIPALQATAAASWWATYGRLLSTSFIENFLARAYSSDRLTVHLADPTCHFLVVKTGMALIGFGQVGPTMSRRDKAPVAPADLYRLYLLPRWQRRGIGARLLLELEGWLRQQEYPYYGAYVHERNEPAKHFYARQGFVHAPACDVQDEWYLVKRLDGCG
ncbi:MAG: GNAT family N-acetyltransferase [Caldilineaceae bacterium]|nr:GNAT family N-acetyltransferase [Caldilineaceae bacterium]